MVRCVCLDLLFYYPFFKVLLLISGINLSSISIAFLKNYKRISCHKGMLNLIISVNYLDNLCFRKCWILTMLHFLQVSNLKKSSLSFSGNGFQSRRLPALRFRVACAVRFLVYSSIVQKILED